MALDNIRKIFSGLWAPHATAASAVPPPIAATDWTQMFKKYASILKPIADTAGTDYEYPIFHNVYSSSIVVTNVTLTPFAALTADDTNYKTISIFQRVAAGSSTAVTTDTTKITGGTGNWVALTPLTLTLSATAANLVVPTLGDLSLSLVHAGSGVAVPVCLVQVEYYFA